MTTRVAPVCIVFLNLLSPPRVLLHSNSQDRMTNCCHKCFFFVPRVCSHLPRQRTLILRVWAGWWHRGAQGKSWRRSSAQLLARVFRTLTSFVYFSFEERAVIPINLAGVGLFQQYALVFYNKMMNQVVSKVSKLSLLCFEEKKGPKMAASLFPFISLTKCTAVATPAWNPRWNFKS